MTMKKSIIPALLIIGGVLLTLYGILLSTLINFNVGLVGTIAIGLVLFLWGIIWQPLHRLSHSSWVKWPYRLFLAGVLLFALTVGLLALTGQRDQVTYKEDALIVLGAGIHGETVSRVLQMRLDTAVAYYEKNPNALIVVSGGQGQGEKISEALAMERYLLQKNVPQDKIIKEDRSTSTEENFKFSKALLDKHFNGDYQIAFTTNTFHIFRAQMIARNSGIESHSIHAPIDFYMVPVVYIREVMALYFYLIFH